LAQGLDEARGQLKSSMQELVLSLENHKPLKRRLTKAAKVGLRLPVMHLRTMFENHLYMTIRLAVAFNVERVRDV